MVRAKKILNVMQIENDKIRTSTNKNVQNMHVICVKKIVPN